MELSINIIIADDHKLFRDGLQQAIRRLSHINVIKQAANGKEVLQLLETNNFDIVFLDITMPVMNGIETAEIMRKKYAETKIIAMTMHHNLDIVHKMMDEGISGYLLKDAPISEIRKAILEVMKGNTFYTPEIELAIKDRPKNREQKKEEGLELNAREKEVLRLICKEESTKDIADKLFLSMRTVETYRLSLLKKTNSKNTAGLVLYAVKNKLLLS
jgi:DNA-binding NarL/FixJ family response regulator